MALVKWDPWREIDDMFDRYTRAGGLPQGGQGIVRTGDWAPRVDIVETDKAFVIEVEVPGVQKDDVKVTVNSGVLTVGGERKQEQEEKGKTFHRVERYYGSFCRSFTLPANIDQDKIKASFKDGICALFFGSASGSQDSRETPACGGKDRARPVYADAAALDNPDWEHARQCCGGGAWVRGAGKAAPRPRHCGRNPHHDPAAAKRLVPFGSDPVGGNSCLCLDHQESSRCLVDGCQDSIEEQ